MIEKLTILAPGLLGGSVARAARERGVARHIALWARRPETRAALAAQPWCDETPGDPADAAEGARLVVIAAPVDQIAPLAARIAGRLPDGAVVTDVGSVKGAIARDGGEAVRRGSASRAEFVGAHPMAGSEKTGWEHGTAALFENRTCFVTPTDGTSPAALAAAEGFWRSLGANVARVSPEMHDEIVAHISHLPQLAASSLCAFLGRAHPDWGAYAGGGLRDTTRIAGSDPELWQPILSANQAAILAALQGWREELGRVEQALARGDWNALSAMMARGRAFRDGIAR